MEVECQNTLEEIIAGNLKNKKRCVPKSTCQSATLLGRKHGTTYAGNAVSFKHNSLLTLTKKEALGRKPNDLLLCCLRTWTSCFQGGEIPKFSQNILDSNFSLPDEA